MQSNVIQNLTQQKPPLTRNILLSQSFPLALGDGFMQQKLCLSFTYGLLLWPCFLISFLKYRAEHQQEVFFPGFHCQYLAFTSFTLSWALLSPTWQQLTHIAMNGLS
uniref:Uncharacterized protein n=1 Tax=Opuntia streptacantha TaxID=393608 RepID=A0A7C9CYY9_OPUST